MYLRGVNISCSTASAWRRDSPRFFQLPAIHFCKLSCTLTMPNLNAELRDAACNGNQERVQSLLTQGNVNIDAIDGGGYTALMFAAQNGHTAVVVRLLENGANIDVINCYGRTALVLAIEMESQDVVDCLVSHGADHNVAELMIEAHYDRQAVSRSLQNTDATELMHAAHAGQQDVIDRLLNENADMHVANEGWTALMYALAQGHTGIARSLVTERAGINDGKLMLAAHYGVDTVIDDMLSQNADILHLDMDPLIPRWTPMMLASLQDRDQSVSYLLEAAIAQLNLDGHAEAELIAVADNVMM